MSLYIIHIKYHPGYIYWIEKISGSDLFWTEYGRCGFIHHIDNRSTVSTSASPYQHAGIPQSVGHNSDDHGMVMQHRLPIPSTTTPAPRAMATPSRRRYGNLLRSQRGGRRRTASGLRNSTSDSQNAVVKGDRTEGIQPR